MAGSKPASTARVIGQQWLSSSPPTSGAVSRWVSTRTRPGSATTASVARTAGIVTECSPPSVTGSAPEREDLLEVGLGALEGALRVAGDDVAVAAVDGGERVGDVEVEQSRCR